MTEKGRTPPQGAAPSTGHPTGRARTAPVPSPSPVTVYITALLALDVLLVVLGWWQMGPAPLEPLLVLTVLGVLGTSLRERDLGPHLGVSFATVVLAAALPLVGPGGAVVVGLVSYLGDLRTQRLRARLFNAAMTGLMGGVGGFVYLLMGGFSPVPTAAPAWELLLRLALPLVVGYAVMTVLNTLLIGVMSHLVSGGRALVVAQQALAQVGPGYLVHALIAFLFVVLWWPAGLGSFSALLILGPLLITQWVLGRDAEERRQHALTVRTLVGALETANPYAVGHSARVAGLCDRMAPRLEVEGPAAEELHFAALLHDIGLMATTHLVPPASGPVDVDYLVATSNHPEAGVRMLRDIDFLGEALPGILHHHERFDGSGYPAGLSGKRIPLFARAIAVADAFDSLTTTRSYRDALTQAQALEELRGRVGSHLDGTVVEALAHALAAREWVPTVIDETARSVYGDAHDHDDPLVSDLYAEWSPEQDPVAAPERAP